MSIRNLITENLKNDQNLKVNSIEADTFIVDNLTVDTLNSTTINTETLNSDNINNTNIIVTDNIQSTTGNFSSTIDSNICTCDNLVVNSGATFGSTIYSDLSLNVYTFYQSNQEFSLYGINSPAFNNNFTLIKMGRIVVVHMVPFSITGASVGTGEFFLEPVQPSVIPASLRPYNSEQQYGGGVMTENGSIIVVNVRYIGTGDFNFKIEKQNQTAFANGVLNLILEKGINFSYIALT